MDFFDTFPKQRYPFLNELDQLFPYKPKFNFPLTKDLPSDQSFLRDLQALLEGKQLPRSLEKEYISEINAGQIFLSNSSTRALPKSKIMTSQIEPMGERAMDRIGATAESVFERQGIEPRQDAGIWTPREAVSQSTRLQSADAVVANVADIDEIVLGPTAAVRVREEDGKKLMTVTSSYRGDNRYETSLIEFNLEEDRPVIFGKLGTVGETGISQYVSTINNHVKGAEEIRSPLKMVDAVVLHDSQTPVRNVIMLHGGKLYIEQVTSNPTKYTEIKLKGPQEQPTSVAA